MRRCVGLVLVLLALVGGTARADVYEVVPTQDAIPDLSYPQLYGLWQQAGSEYGIPWQVLAAINKVESNFGRNMGPSSAGAIGWMQFLPETWDQWGYDANGDGVADPWNPTDAVFSAARYLAAAGGTSDLYGAIYAYNHADWYVREVLNLANLYEQSPTVAGSLDQMQQQLDAARSTVAELSAEMRRATLLSTRLDLQPRLFAAEQALKQAQDASAAASFTPAASDLLASPMYDSGYVFPVGGGPGVVTASHTHHDYPAVDIDAPLGSPVYALANSIVIRAWSTPDPTCGIGFTLAADDGQIWTYCHMALLDPSVIVGDQLTAGQQVGLVGDTGDATGPHLHLQLQPADAWPQQEPWFQAFAGRAFSWSDEPAQPLRTLQVLSAQRVFEVVPQTPVVLFSRP